jgi:phosphomannomutase
VSINECHDGAVFVYDDLTLACCDIKHQQRTLWINNEAAKKGLRKTNTLKAFADQMDNIWVYGQGTLMIYSKKTGTWNYSIGEQFGMLEAKGKEDSYICGFEESYGYLTGSYVRDKDAVDAAFMICEMFAFYKTRGISILDKLDELYNKFGYCLNTLHSYEFEGSAGFAKMQDIMKKFREGKDTFGDRKTKSLKDYSKGIDGLPASDVLKFFIEGGSVVVRPSGTEPKLKTYISVVAGDEQEARAIEEKISQDLAEYMR